MDRMHVESVLLIRLLGGFSALNGAPHTDPVPNKPKGEKERKEAEPGDLLGT